MSRIKPDDNPSENAAETRHVFGWACKKCNRFYGIDERMARYCCATSFPCECGGRCVKPFTCCDNCRKKRDTERWYAKPAVVWDGEFPVASEDGEYYFSAEDLIDGYFENHDEAERLSNLADYLDSLRLSTCKPNHGRHFSMNEFLCDDLAEDQELDSDEIDRIVNDWIASKSPISWGSNDDRIDVGQMIQTLKACGHLGGM